MPKMAFVVRPEYEGVDGTVVFGADGETLRISEALDGGSEIITSNPRLQEALMGFEGLDGPVFEVEEYNNSGDRVTQEVSAIKPPKSLKSKRKSADQSPSYVNQQPAEHGGSGSGYEGMPVMELAALLRERGVDFNETSSDQELIELLEKDDSKETTSGS
jgi:hypothetical protein